MFQVKLKIMTRGAYTNTLTYETIRALFQIETLWLLPLFIAFFHFSSCLFIWTTNHFLNPWQFLSTYIIFILVFTYKGTIHLDFKSKSKAKVNYKTNKKTQKDSMKILTKTVSKIEKLFYLYPFYTNQMI